MPEAPAAAPIVSAPATPPSAPPSTPAPAAPERKGPSETAKSLVSLLLKPSTDDGQEPKKKETPPPAPTPEPKKDTPAPEGGIKRGKKKDDPPPPEPEKRPSVPKREDLSKSAAPAPAAPAAPVAAKPQTDAEFENDLIEEERMLLDDARAAEKHLGEKYKGQSTKMTAFLKEAVKRAAAAEKGELDGEPYDEAEHSKWYGENLPKIGARDQRELLKLSVREDVTKEFEPRIAAEGHERWVEKEAPKVKAKGDAIYAKLRDTALPEEVLTAATARLNGITDPEQRMAKVKELEKEYAMEFKVADNVVNVATSDLEEFHRLTTKNPATQKDMVDLAKDAMVWDGHAWVINPAPTSEKGKQHARILSLVKDIGEDFSANGGTALKKDGKWFVTREQWYGMDESQRGPFWTFSNEELTERAMARVPLAVKQLVTQENQRLEALGYKRVIAAPAAPAPAAPAFSPASMAPPAPRSAPTAPNNGAPPPSVGASLAAKLMSNPSQG